MTKPDLRCDDNNLRQNVISLRKWVAKNSLIVDCRLDDLFLLRFLRKENCTLADAQTNLIKYLNFRQSLPQYMLKLDCDESKVAELIHNGYLFASPVRDSMGRRVIIGIAKKLDITRFNNLHMGKVHALTYETLLEDESNQIAGFQHFGDLAGLDITYSTFMPLNDIYLGVGVGQNVFPMKHCKIHFINMNSTVKIAYDFLKELLTKKIRDRVMVHSSMTELQNNLEAKCLPKEYNGDIPMTDMIEWWKKELQKKKPIISSMEKMKCLIPQNDCLGELQGSFKKLEID